MKVQKEHKKKTLMNYTKEELADLIIMLEHNYNVLNERFDNQYNNCIKFLNDMSLVNKTYFEAKEIVNQSVIKPKTNFDEIGKNIESLAEFMDSCDICPLASYTIDEMIKKCRRMQHINNCRECIKEWLQQEVC